MIGYSPRRQPPLVLLPGAMKDGSLRNHDIVSGSLLVLTAAGLAVFCSSLFAFAFI